LNLHSLCLPHIFIIFHPSSLLLHYCLPCQYTLHTHSVLVCWTAELVYCAQRPGNLLYAHGWTADVSMNPSNKVFLTCTDLTYVFGCRAMEWLWIHVHSCVAQPSIASSWPLRCIIVWRWSIVHVPWPGKNPKA